MRKFASASRGLVVIDDAPAVMKSRSFPWSRKMFSDIAFSAVRARSSCCRVMRPRSDPSSHCLPTVALRARAHARAVLPSSTLGAALDVEPGLRRDDVTGDAHRHSAERVDHALESHEVDDGVVVDVDAGEVLDRALDARRGLRRVVVGSPAVVERDVELAGPALVDLAIEEDAVGGSDPRVARDRHELDARPVGRDVHDDRRVVSHSARVAAERGVLADATVRTHQQDVDGLSARGVLGRGRRHGALIPEEDGHVHRLHAVKRALDVDIAADNRESQHRRNGVSRPTEPGMAGPATGMPPRSDAQRAHNVPPLTVLIRCLLLSASTLPDEKSLPAVNRTSCATN